MINFDLNDILGLAIGTIGGAVDLLIQVRAGKMLLTMINIVASLSCAAFSAFLVDLLFLQDVSDNIQIGICGVSGLSSTKVLSLITKKFFSVLEEDEHL